MEDMFDKDITIINQYIDSDHKKAYKVSYVKGFWSSNDGVSINGTQLTKSDGLSARILMNDSRNKPYQKPEEFKKEQKTWTLQNDDYLVKEKVEDFTTIIKLLENYQDVIKITNIAIKDYGSEDMWHFAITGA
ncbi:putative uncharacterized protein [Clostridium sp. CAG:452]|jgi:hypothetical protein|nr:putative uncharacterized protein [Clostridium sp. CAG:452]